MRFALRISALLLAVATAGRTADPAVEELFKQARTKVLDNARRMPHYTCVETIDRTQYQPSIDPSSCQALVTMRRLSPGHGNLAIHDRLRLDVAVVNGGEIFSWAGAGKFESRDVGEIVGGGASGSGEFGGFLMSVFGNETDNISYRGQRNDLALFSFTVPLAKSSYHYRSTGPDVKMAYHGTFQVDPADGDLEQLEIEPDGFPRTDPVCMVRHQMDYTRVKIGSGTFVLPEVSSMDALYHTGAETLNTTHYANCREYVGESTIRFDDVDTPSETAAAKAPLQPLPPKTKLSIALTTPINTEIAAAGDAIDGVVMKSGYKVHGRIMRLQQYLVPTPRWFIAIRFDRIERNGVEQPISLRPLDDGVRQVPGRQPPMPPGSLDKPAGAGLFVFAQHGDMTLDQKFRSDWEVR